jgi:hypothetical protein
MPANEKVVMVWVNAGFGLTKPSRLAEPMAKSVEGYYIRINMNSITKEKLPPA